MKRIAMFLLAILIVGAIFVSCLYYLKNNDSDGDTIKEKEPNVIINNPIKEDNENINDSKVEDNVSSEDEEDISNDKTDDIENETIEDDSDFEDKLESNTSSNNNSDKKDEVVKEESSNKDESKPNDNVDNNNSNEVNNSKDVINDPKIVCSNDDAGYKSWLNNILAINTSSRRFNTMQEAINFGEESARNYGYGYFYDSTSTTYNSDSCYKENYFVRLYIPAKSCNGNPMMYLPRNEEVIDMYRYLDKVGYSCPEKFW